MHRSRQVTQAPDGRSLVFAEWGDLDGSPVFALHGTPGCRGTGSPGIPRPGTAQEIRA